MGRGTVAAGFASGLIGYAASRGVDRHALASRAGIAPEDLASPEHRLPLEKYVLLMRAEYGIEGGSAPHRNTQTITAASPSSSMQI